MKGHYTVLYFFKLLPGRGLQYTTQSAYIKNYRLIFIVGWFWSKRLYIHFTTSTIMNQPYFLTWHFKQSYSGTWRSCQLEEILLCLHLIQFEKPLNALFPISTPLSSFTEGCFRYSYFFFFQEVHKYSQDPAIE